MDNKFSKNKVTIVMYHYVRDLENSRYKAIKGLDVKDFKKQLAFLLDHFTIIKVEDLIAFYEDKKANPLPENSCLLTFDDGYIDHFTTVFPILDSLKIQGSFYIPAKTFAEEKVLDVNKIHFILAATRTNELLNELFQQLDYYRGVEYDFPENKELFAELAVPTRFDKKEVVFIKRILQTTLPESLRKLIASNLFAKYIGMAESAFAKELYLNLEQIKCLKRHGMYIGVHGYDHYWLGKLTKEAMQKDIEQALSAMSSVIDLNSWVMNYPYGSHCEAVVDFIKENGCKLGFTTKVAKANLENDSRYLLPRLDTNDFPPKSEHFS